MAALAHAIPGEGNDVILPYHGVVDYSFKELKAVVDVGNEMPRNSDVLGIEAKLKERFRETAVDAAVAAKLGSPKRLINKKQIIGLRLNNNHLTDLHEINKQLAIIPKSPIPKPELSLMWLDVSFNQLTTVDKSLLTLENLKSLYKYMHGNKIGNLAQMEKLKSLHCLEKLTTNGNPFEAKKFYRQFIVGCVPQLRSLDHTSILNVSLLFCSIEFVMHSVHYTVLCFDFSCEINAQHAHAIQTPAKNKTGVTKDELGRGIRFYANYVVQREEARIAKKEAAEANY
ncbi:unnamed protein product [Amoebophrya sp. A120]|nr:unnamed protein product [Amoebophrya sp. A120]|eukprot:GSA120T00015719001.1